MTRHFVRKNHIVRLSHLFLTTLGVLAIFAASAAAQNPVPFIDQPLVPDATAPGGTAFTLTVNGAGFVSSSAVNWNGSPRATTFVSSSQLTASIPASDIATASTVAVTVVNPRPGGGVSNTQFFSIAATSTSVSFLPPVTYGAGGSIAQGVVIADVSGDGKPDIVVSSWDQSNSEAPGVVGVLLGNGDGTFKSVVTYETGGAPNYAVTVADVNGDGEPDIIASSCAPTGGDCGTADGVASVLINNGDGTFQKAVAYDTGAPEGSAVSVADMNGDGILDLIVTNFHGEANGDGTVAVLLGNGDGTFQKAVIYDSGGLDANGQIVADVNGDGIPDVVAVNYSSCTSCSGGSIGVLLGKGNGTFQPVVSYLTEGNTSSGIAVGDINNDGHPDIIVGSLDGTVSVLLNKGNGEFSPAVTYNAGGGVNVLTVGDMNGDRNLDIVVPTNSSECGVLVGTGDGTFQAVKLFDAGGSDCNTVAVGDVNGDGKQDIVATIGFSNLVSVLLNGTLEDTTTTLSSTPNPSNYGQSVTFTATVSSTSGTPTGTVIFYDGSTAIGTVTLASGSASLSTSSLPAGSQSITAAYQGSSTFAPSTSAALNQVVNGTTTATSLTSSLNPSVFGQSVTFTAAVSSKSGTPSGTVIFYDGSTAIGSATLSSGSASLATSSLPAGSQSITAAYQGSSIFASSTSAALRQVVNSATPTTTSLTSSLNPSVFGQSVTFTAAVSSKSGTPSGTVVFYDGSNAIGSATISSGSASLATSSLAEGSQSITAAYQGSGGFAPSTSAPLSQVVNTATTSTTLISSVNPAQAKQRVTYTATVSSQFGGTATGTVTFADSGRTIAMILLSNNRAAYQTSYNNAGARSITATYSGDTNNAGSVSSVLTEQIKGGRYPTTTALVGIPNPAAYGQAVTYTATVTSSGPNTPTGHVKFTGLGEATLVGSLATYTKKGITAGTHSVTAEYEGDSESAPSASAVLEEVVNKASTTTVITSSANPSSSGLNVTFTAKVTSSTGLDPFGTVTFTAGAATLGTVEVTDTVASISTATLPVGSTKITATYSGSAGFGGSSASLTQKVNP